MFLPCSGLTMKSLAVRRVQHGELYRGRRSRNITAVRIRSTANSGSRILSPFDCVTKERGFLPQYDPLQRLALSKYDASAAQWEAVLSDLPKLAVATGGPTGTATGSGASPTSSSSKGVLRRTLEALPPFPLHKLLPAGWDAQRPTSWASATAVEMAGWSDQPAAGSPSPAIGTLGEEAAAAAAGTEDNGSELWRAYLLLSFLAHAYMWCEPGPPPASLPAVLAVPWVRVAAAVDMPPVLTYSSYNLYNWRRLDPSEAPRLGNTVCLQNFLGGPDEEWFRLVHVDIESRAGPAVAGLAAMQAAAAKDDGATVLSGLVRVAGVLRDMQATLSRMGEKCDPYIYYHRVRTPMSGWRNNPDLPKGLIYEGVSQEPLQLYGETGAQSSVLHAFDAALGVQHDQVWLRDYLDTMIQHMPPAHRAFLAGLSSANAGPSNVRSYVLSYQDGAAGELRDAYNAAIEEMERFRSQHKAFAYNYIAKWAKREATGTGGSDFMPALAGYRDTTSRHLLP